MSNAWMVVLFVCAALSVRAVAQPVRSPMELDLNNLKDYKALRVSSNNKDPNSNDDSKRPIPGETIVLADLQGPGVITHIWITVAAREYGWPRLLRFRVYYDGSPVPSIDAPLGDFFAVGHGMERPVNSLMIQDSSSGRSRNCYWSMPFRRSVKVTITNEGWERVSNVYYHVDWRKVRSLPANTAYFHAIYRQATPVKKASRYEFLSVVGRGHYLGTVLSVVQTEPGWFGEGDEFFYVDGESRPSIEGTGTEDYFNNAWALRITDGPYMGVPVAEAGTRTGARMTAYRWHLFDPVPFQKSLRFEIETEGWTYNSDGTVRSGFESRADLFSSVAFWYQQGIAKGMPTPPYGAARLPHGNAKQIEIEAALSGTTTKGGKASVLKEAFWSRDLLLFESTETGSSINIPFDVPEDGRYELLAQMAHAPNYGRYVAHLDGKPLVTEDLEHEPGANMDQSGEINLWNTELYVAEDHLLGWKNLTRGKHTLTFVCVGKDARSLGQALGMDSLILARVDRERARENPAAVELRRLGEMGPSAAPRLSQVRSALRNPDPQIRQAAAWAMTQLDEAAAPAVRDLEQLLTDHDSVVRGLAAITLRNMSSAAVFPVLPAVIAALQDKDENVRLVSAEVLARQGKNAITALPKLIAAARVEGEHVHVLRSLAAAMGAIGPGASPALPVLKQLLMQPRVRWAAQAAIKNISGGLTVER